MDNESLIDQLDRALNTLLAKPSGRAERSEPANGDAKSVDADYLALLDLARDLKDLPDQNFRARLKAELLDASKKIENAESVVPPHGKPLLTIQDIHTRLKEIAAAPAMQAFDVAWALEDLPQNSMRFLTSLNNHTIGVCHGSEPSHWERHPAGDELLHILEGEAEVVTLTDAGTIRSTLTAGSVFICPRGLWHQLVPRPYYAMLFATPGAGTEHSKADDPPSRDSIKEDTRRSASVPTMGQPRDINQVMDSVPKLTISDETTYEEADAAVGRLAMMDDHLIGVMQYSGQTPWERHPDGDELLHALDGEVEITVLTDEGPVHKTLSAGSVFVCPRGLWHRQFSSPSVAMLFATATRTTEISFATDPRVAM